MTSQHHHHQQHHQEPNKTMQHHQASHQQGLLLERRIIQLLTETNLTFKEIIIKLDGENLNASIGMIRRINRDNRYRRPRYDSKLTPAQRESLVEELRDHKGLKPNLSLLAKRYGVCHGSVWYWWDKLNRIKRCDPLTRRGANSTMGLGLGRGVGAGGDLCVGKTQLQMFSAGRGRRRRMLKASGDLDPDQSGGSSSGMSGELYQQQRRRNFNNILLDERFNYVGRVSIVGREQTGGGGLGMVPIELPILMFARKELAEIDSVKTSASSGSLELSPSPVVVVDDDDDDDDDVDDDDPGDAYEDIEQIDEDETSDSRDSSSQGTMECQLLSEERVDMQRVNLATAEASLG